MSRTLPTGLDTALQAVETAPVFLVELAWPDATVYMWSGYHDLVWNGHTWLGLGHLGGISEVKESTDMAANGLVLTLSGIPSAIVAEALRNDTQGRSGKVYFGVLSTSGFSIDPYLVFDGLIDVPSINDDGKTATVTLQLEKEFIDNRSGARRYTDQDQKSDFPSDPFFEFVAGLAQKNFTWGKATVYASGGGTGAGDGSQINEP